MRETEGAEDADGWDEGRWIGCVKAGYENDRSISLYCVGLGEWCLPTLRFYITFAILQCRWEFGANRKRCGSSMVEFYAWIGRAKAFIAAGANHWSL